MKFRTAAGFIGLFQLTLIIVCGYGWVHNIIVIIHQAGEPGVTKMFVLRCIGIVVFPLGVFLGYC